MSAPMTSNLFDPVKDELAERLDKLDTSDLTLESRLVVAATATLHVAMMKAALDAETSLPADMPRGKKYALVIRVMTKALASAFGSILFRHMHKDAVAVGASVAGADFSSMLISLGELLLHQTSNRKH